MNYDSSKLITEQKNYDTHRVILIEDNKNPQNQLTPEQIKAAKLKIQRQADKSAREIFKDLMKAFDMDGDGDFKDWDGTNEGGAVKAIKKIKNKETLDALNKKIASWKQYKDLKSWVNAEMSDFDSEYGQIWDKLEKMGYAGANRNILLKVAGYTPAGMLIKGADKAIDYLRKLSLKDIMEGLRSIIGGVAGTIATAVLAATGPIGGAINVAIFGVLTVWDIYQAATKDESFSFFNLVLDIISAVTAGVGVAKVLSPVKAVVAGEKTAEGFMKIVAQKFPKIAKWLGGIGKFLGNAGAKVASLFNKGMTFLIQKMPFLSKILNPLKSVVGKIGAWASSLAKAFGGTTAGQVVQQVAKGTGTILQKLGKWTGGKLLQVMKSKVGAALFKEADTEIVNYIEKYIVKNANSATIDNIRPKFCKDPNSNYCKTFDIILTSVNTAYEGSKITKKIKKSQKNIKDTDVVLDKAKERLAQSKQLTKGTEKGYKATKEVGKTVAGTQSQPQNIGTVKTKPKPGMA